MTRKRLVDWTVGAVVAAAAFALGAAAVGGTNGRWMPHVGAGGRMPHGAASGWMGPGTGMMGPGTGAMGGGWGFGMLFGVLLWTALLVGVAVAAYRLFAREGGDERARPDPAMDELRARYARGEIDDSEFEERRRRLTGQ
ncbi:SHOCT domain-containing protein [Halogeometricum sp. S1BR25-6]|uniref:SHOCT domain-containing protein n=1 Tax=Halogeometricum salsisoli TaxID=2950536 RepID=A0ABU2GFY6_9EURY|nr:SHOCT domain-containing protein [Halogeometricum sp. S1BR25-6]MDS0299094.1 SHOCT domain-containing protein [Halogeometricum sp. S1BR25-6]